MPARSRTKQPAVEVDPTRITRHCAHGLHHRCPGRVVRFVNGRQKYEPCQCPQPDCGHGPRPRKRR